jgi:hypothetical protein
LNDVLSEEKHEIKRKTLYSMLNEYTVFQEIKKVKTTIVDIGADDEDEENKEEDVKEKEFVQ